MRRRFVLPVLVLVLALLAGGLLCHHRRSAPAGTPQAVELADAKLPDELTSATVLAVGEATHGTREFRVAWQQVAAKVADQGFTTIALEENAGRVSLVDQWVQGGPGTAEQAVEQFGFRFNRTREMVDFVTWARDYNQTRPAVQKVRFYGLDMQRPDQDRDLAIGWLADHDAAAAKQFAQKLAGVTDDTAYDKDSAGSLLPAARELNNRVNSLAGKNAGDQAAPDDELRARLSARALEQSLQRGSQGVTGYDRDKALFGNLDFLVTQRALAGSGRTLLLAHNGHVDRNGSATMAPGSKLGTLSVERWGDKYKVIGADSRHTRLQDSGAERSFTVNSSVRGMFTGIRTGLLVFSQASPENAEVLQRRVPMATAGSPFPRWHAWLPFSHQVKLVHADAWDALIFVDETTPTTPLG